MQLSHLEVKTIADALAFRKAYCKEYKLPYNNMNDSLLVDFTREYMERTEAMEDHIRGDVEKDDEMGKDELLDR
jgi:hypothetical protein